MKVLELLAFGTLAGGLHLAAFAMFGDPGGMSVPGGGGTQEVSLQGAPPELQTLMERWEDAPDAATEITAPQDAADLTADAPISPDRELPLPERFAALSQPAAPMKDRAPTPFEAAPVVPIRDPSAQLPAAADPLAELAVPAPALTAPERPDTRLAAMAPPTRSDLPVIEMEPPEASGPLVRSKRPRMAPPRPESKQVQRAPTPPRQSARAAGTGNAAQAGQTRAQAPKAKATGATSGQKAKLKTVWGSKVRSKIQRNVIVPRDGSRAPRVGVSVTIAPSGRILSYGIAKSSGQASADQAALRAIKRAGRFPAAPKGLTDSSYTFVVGIAVQ